MSDIRDEIADFIADTPLGPDGFPALMAAIATRFPSATVDDVDAGMERGIEIIEERAANNSAEANALHHLAPLFDGMPEDMPIGECARIKAERGDSLALAFLKWEQEQAGGLQ